MGSSRVPTLVLVAKGVGEKLGKAHIISRFGQNCGFSARSTDLPIYILGVASYETHGARASHPSTSNSFFQFTLKQRIVWQRLLCGCLSKYICVLLQQLL